MVFPIPLQRRHLLRYIATLFVLLPIFLFLFYISTSDSQGPLPWEPGFSPPEGPGRYEVEVPAYLEEKTFHIFDDAVKQGKVLFEETEPEIVVDDVGFEVCTFCVPQSSISALFSACFLPRLIHFPFPLSAPNTLCGITPP